MSQEEVIEELVTIMLMQREEIRKLERKLERINQYIQVYEKRIKGERE